MNAPSFLIFLLATIVGGAIYAFSYHRGIRALPAISGRRLFWILAFAVPLVGLILAGRHIRPEGRVFSLLHALDSFAAAQIVLGFAFGLTLAHWIGYLVEPTRLSAAHTQRLHNRWGFVLLALLILGVVPPFLPNLLDHGGGFSITTPFVSISAKGTEPQPSGTFVPEGLAVGGPAYGLKSDDARNMIADASKDKSYLELFFDGTAAEKSWLEWRHIRSTNLLRDSVLVTIVACVNAHRSYFSDPRLIRTQLHIALTTYEKVLADSNPPDDRIMTLFRELRDAALNLREDLLPLASFIPADAKSDWNQCDMDLKDGGTARMEKSRPHEFERILPYTTLILASLYAASGYPDFAAKASARWLETASQRHVDPTSQARLPDYYVIRAQFYLTLYLQLAYSSSAVSNPVPLVTLLHALADNVRTFEGLFRTSPTLCRSITGIAGAGKTRDRQIRTAGSTRASWSSPT